MNSTVIPQGRILLVSYHFPPGAAVGGLRVGKFARFLPRFGWTPYVLSAKSALKHEGFDLSRLEGLEDVPVVRTGELPRLLALYSALKSRLWGGGQTTSAHAPRSRTDRVHKETFLGHLKRVVVSLTVYLPDKHKNWSLIAVGSGLRLIASNRIDCVLTSGPPFSSHLVGLVAKVFMGVRWVADFRDPWVDVMGHGGSRARSTSSDRIERWMEASVVRFADKVVMTSERMRAAMAIRYPETPGNHFVTVHNSIDVERCRPGPTVAKYDRFTISYTGELYSQRTPELLFRAVGQLLQERRICTNDIRIKLVGDCREVEGVGTMSLADQYGLGQVVDVVDKVPYMEAVRIMQQSHLLLVLAPPGHRLAIPAKVFDYLGSGSAILGLVAPGAASDLIEETGGGRCFSESDLESLCDYLSGLVSDRSYVNLGNDPNAFSRYDAGRLTQRLVSEALESASGRTTAATVQM